MIHQKDLNLYIYDDERDGLKKLYERKKVYELQRAVKKSY